MSDSKIEPPFTPNQFATDLEYWKEAEKFQRKRAEAAEARIKASQEQLAELEQAAQDEINRLEEQKLVLSNKLAEAESTAVLEGWKLVPKQMTDEMRDAGNIYVLNRGTLCRIWDDVLAAAPQPETDRGSNE